MLQRQHTTHQSEELLADHLFFFRPSTRLPALSRRSSEAPWHRRESENPALGTRTPSENVVGIRACKAWWGADTARMNPIIYFVDVRVVQGCQNRRLVAIPGRRSGGPGRPASINLGTSSEPISIRRPTGSSPVQHSWASFSLTMIACDLFVSSSFRKAWPRSIGTPSVSK